MDLLAIAIGIFLFVLTATKDVEKFHELNTTEAVPNFRHNTRYCHITMLRRIVSIPHASHIDVDMTTGNIYITASNPDKLHCLDQRGRTMWVRSVPEAEGVAVSDGVVYVSGQQSLEVLMFEADSGAYIGFSILHAAYTDLVASLGRLYGLSGNHVDIYNISSSSDPNIVLKINFEDVPQNIITDLTGNLLVSTPGISLPAIFNKNGKPLSVFGINKGKQKGIILPAAVYIQEKQIAFIEPLHGLLACSIMPSAIPNDVAMHPCGDLWVTSSNDKNVVIY